MALHSANGSAFSKQQCTWQTAVHSANGSALSKRQCTWQTAVHLANGSVLCKTTQLCTIFKRLVGIYRWWKLIFQSRGVFLFLGTGACLFGQLPLWLIFDGQGHQGWPHSVPMLLHNDAIMTSFNCTINSTYTASRTWALSANLFVVTYLEFCELSSQPASSRGL